MASGDGEIPYGVSDLHIAPVDEPGNVAFFGVDIDVHPSKVTVEESDLRGDRLGGPHRRLHLVAHALRFCGDERSAGDELLQSRLEFGADLLGPGFALASNLPGAPEMFAVRPAETGQLGLV